MNEKNALITGASRGIGKEIARHLAAKGYDLILTCHRQEDQLTEWAEDLMRTYNCRVTTYCGDIGSPSFIEELFSHLTCLDLLVNNAGISHIGLLQDMSYEEWQQLINVNLSSLFLTSRKSIPLFLQNEGGRILNITSVWGNCGASMEVAYSASKGGVNAFTKALAKELAPSGIAVNAIACGFIDTEMNAHLSPEEKEELIAQIPANRAGSPYEVGRLAALLAEAPLYMTGQVITIDGGWT